MQIKFTEVFDPSSINKTEPLYLDVETHKDDYTDIRLVQLYQTHWGQVQVLDTNLYDILDIYNIIKDCHVVAHNYGFEANCFSNDCRLYRNPFKKFSDTFLLARLEAWKLDAFNLAEVSKHFHGEDYYARLGVKKEFQKSFLDTAKSNKRAEPISFEQKQYAALDVLVMPKIYEACKHWEDHFLVKLDYRVIDYILTWQYNGLPVDPKKWKEAKAFALGEIARTQEVLGKLNVNSFKQVRAFLGGVDASDDSALAQLIDKKVHGAAEIRDQRKYVKQLNFLDRYNKPRVRGYYYPRTISGRTASDCDNLQQIPREMKSLFGCEDEFIVHADYAALELRGICCIVEERVLEKLFREGEDLHKYAASNIYKKPSAEITKFERLIGKFANFTLGYGAGPSRFKEMLMKEAGIFISEAEARAIVKGWKEGFPAIKRWHLQNNDKYNRGVPYDTTLSGRNYKAKLYTDLNAIKIQGSCAEAFKLAMNYLGKKNYPIMNAVHDSFLIRAKTLEEARQTGHDMAKAMIVAWFEVFKQSGIPDLPMPTDAEIGKNWKEIDQGNAIEVISYAGTYEEYLTLKEEVAQW